MNFEDMKRIWDAQRQEHLFIIDERQLHKQIQRKKKRGGKSVNLIEGLLMTVNFLCGISLFTLSAVGSRLDIYQAVMGVFMVAMAAYVVVRRRERIRKEKGFGRDMLGDLDYAISNATYQAHFSIVSLLSVFPIGILLVLSALQAGKPPWLLVTIVLFVGLTYWAGRWEHRSWHLKQKQRLLAMRETLTSVE